MKKILKLTAEIQKACCSDIAQKKMAHILRGTDFRLFEVKDPFLVGLGILQHFQLHYWCANLISAICTHTGINHAYPSVPDIDFFHFQTHTLAKLYTILAEKGHNNSSLCETTKAYFYIYP